MKCTTTFGFLLMLLVIGTPFIYLAYSSNGRTTSNSVDCRKAKTTITIKRRNLNKVNIGEEDNNNNNVQLEDYGVIDPVPSTTTSVRPGPIQHGTPLLPFIPEPSPPPTHPDQLDFP
ncbi:hypothetical protein ABFX02_14G264300 [Erythranthe guttata]